VAPETIYCALYHLSIRPVPTGSARLLRSGKFSRRPRSRTNVKPPRYIADALKIGDRPAHIATREEAGHWEGDRIMGKGNKTATVTLVERTSRLLVAFALRPGNRSDNMCDQLIEALEIRLATLRSRELSSAGTAQPSGLGLFTRRPHRSEVESLTFSCPVGVSNFDGYSLIGRILQLVAGQPERKLTPRNGRDHFFLGSVGVGHCRHIGSYAT